MIDMFETEAPDEIINKYIKPVLNKEWCDFLDNNILYNVGCSLKRIQQDRDELINEGKVGYQTYPDDRLVFRAFNLTPPNKVKVVILGEYPEPTDNTDGLAFSCQKYVSKALSQIYFSITKDRRILDKGLSDTYPRSLEHWATQGVLLLNTTLMVKQGRERFFTTAGFTPFIEHVLNQIHNNNHETIFLFLGNKTKPFEEFVDERYLISTTCPWGSRYWDNDSFSKVNHLLKFLLKSKIDWIDVKEVTGTIKKDSRNNNTNYFLESDNSVIYIITNNMWKTISEDYDVNDYIKCNVVANKVVDFY